MTTTLNRTDPYKTIRQVLPYEFRLLATDKLAIHKTNGQAPLVVTRAQVEHILTRDDLDVHRRRMYEAAKAEFDREALSAQPSAVDV
jgi:hypothetical protein